MDNIRKEGADGNITNSEVPGVLIVHLVLMIGGSAALISGQIGARTIAILTGVMVMVALVFFFIFIPNLMFIQGARMTQFNGDHFSSISGGWYIAMVGSLLLVVSQFIGHVKDKDKLPE
jgi:hypothetical protein